MLLENSQADNLNLTIEDILIKRDMDFINKIKLPFLYKAFNRSWELLEREEKASLIMNYVEDIELEVVRNNLCKIKQINFRSTFYTQFKELFEKGYIDTKIDMEIANGVSTKVRYSEYLPTKNVMDYFYRLNEVYKVDMYKGTINLKTGKFEGMNIGNSSIVRIFPLEKRDENKEFINMGMFVTNANPNDIKIDNNLDIFNIIP